MSEELDFSVEEMQEASAAHLSEGGQQPTALDNPNEQPDPRAAADPATPQGNQTPDPAGYPTVLDRFPSEMRDELAHLPESTLMSLSQGYMRTDDYTRKTQHVADRGREQDKDTTDAEAWRRLIANPEARGAVLEVLQNSTGTTAQEQQFDWVNAEGEDIDAEIDRRTQAAAEKLYQQRVSEPAAMANAIKQEALTYRGEMGTAVTDEGFKRAFTTMVGKYGQQALTPDNVKLLLEPFVEIEKLRLQVNGHDSGGAINRAATPVAGRSVAPATQPAWKTEKRQPTMDEKIQETLAAIQRRTGDRMTPQDLDTLLEVGD